MRPNAGTAAAHESKASTDGYAIDLLDLADIATTEDFAIQLTKLRQRLGLTIRQVAKLSGLPDSTIAGYFAGHHLPSVSTTRMFVAVLRACGVTDAAAIENWLNALRRLRATNARPRSQLSPYRGLAAFQVEDADLFHGRDSLVQVLTDRIAAAGATPEAGMVVVVGPSGAGKSSLLRAGLVPAIRERVAALFIPGSRPLSELAHQVAYLTGQDPSTVEPAMRATPADSGKILHEAILAAEDRPLDGPPVLIVDQFEEIFSVPDQAERNDFITALNAIASTGTAIVVISLRADFYIEATRYRPLLTALQTNQVVVGPMSEQELRDAIIRPAAVARITVQAGLVEILLRDIAPASGGAIAAGSLPMLSHALLTTWQSGRSGRTMTIADYQATGGVSQSVAVTAEQAYAQLTGTQRKIARQLFLRLIRVTDDSPDTRQRVPLRDLTGGTDPTRLADHHEVLKLFAQARLLTLDVETVEISHDTLLTAWPRLREWTDADREHLHARSRLAQAADTWQQLNRSRDALLRGELLADACRIAANARLADTLTDAERQFLAACTRTHRQRRRGIALLRLAAPLGILVALAILIGSHVLG